MAASTNKTWRLLRALRRNSLVIVVMAVMALVGAACSQEPLGSADDVPAVEVSEEVAKPEDAQQADEAGTDLPEAEVSEEAPKEAPKEEGTEVAADVLDSAGDTAVDSAGDTDAAPVESIPETLAFSADATAEAETMLIALETEIGVGDDILTMSGKGAVEGDVTAMQVTFGGAFISMFRGSGLNRKTLAEPMTMIADSEHSFVKWKVLNDLGDLGDVWVYSPVEVEANPFVDRTAYDPATFLEMLYRADDSVREVGTKQLSGRTVTGYSGSFSAPNNEIQQYVDGSGARLDEVQTTVWISDDDLVRQIEADFAIDGLFYRITMTFSSYGEPVNIDVPSVSDAVPMSSLDLAG